MIIGTGVDILNIERIRGIISRHGDRFLNKVYTKQERIFCENRLKSIESFAKIFSIKEAVIKAISTVSGVFWKDIDVLHEKNGKPFVKLKNRALENLLKRINGKSFIIEVSVSDEIPYVCSFAIIETI